MAATVMRRRVSSSLSARRRFSYLRVAFAVGSIRFSVVIDVREY
jgi:hypothetical protein